MALVGIAQPGFSIALTGGIAFLVVHAGGLFQIGRARRGIGKGSAGQQDGGEGQCKGADFHGRLRVVLGV